MCIRLGGISPSDCWWCGGHVIHASADRVERSAARGVFCCIPVECPVVLKGIVLNWVPSGGSGRRWSGVFPHTTSAFYRRRGLHKTPSKQTRHVMRFHAPNPHGESKNTGHNEGVVQLALYRDGERRFSLRGVDQMWRGWRSNGHPLCHTEGHAG